MTREEAEPKSKPGVKTLAYLVFWYICFTPWTYGPVLRPVSA
jgi:hypothetical protein